MRLNWERFFRQVQGDVRLWLFFMVLFGMYRMVFLLFFHGRTAGVLGFEDMARIMSAGARFDGMASAYIALVPFLFSAACGFFPWEWTAARFRVAYAGVVLGITVFFFGIDIGFFGEFNERINSFIFQFFIDDTKALVVTIWEDYHPVLYFLAMGVIVGMGLVCLRRLLRRPTIPMPSFSRRGVAAAARIFITFALLGGLVVSARGTLFNRQPFHRKWLVVTSDEVLDKSVMNIYTSLRYAIIEFVNLTLSDRGLEEFLPDRDIVGAARFAFSTDVRYSNLDKYYRRKAGGPVQAPPRHIFIIIGESYDSWPLLEKYRSLGLMENLKEFAREGINFPYFIPASDLTMFSLATIFTGLPDSGINVNNHIRSRTPYPGSIAETFNRLGYRTRFFYGGYPTWQRVSEFAREQGFSEVYDVQSMAASKTKTPWGVDDRELFDLVLKTVGDASPSLDMILTTNNHPPFPINVWAKGFRLFRIPPELVPEHGRVIDRKILGHIWYTDQCVGYFVREMEHRVPMPLFVITGDHYGRNSLTSQPDLFEESCVPLVLYGGDVVRELPCPSAAVGCHLDIMPTLVEMVAPKGFAYHAMGRNLLSPRGEVVGIGKNRIITDTFLIDTRNLSNPWRLPLSAAPESIGDIGRLKRLYDALNGIAWWRVNYGPDIVREDAHLSKKR